jgi:hypothetical protein
MNTYWNDFTQGMDKAQKKVAHKRKKSDDLEVAAQRTTKKTKKVTDTKIITNKTKTKKVRDDNIKVQPTKTAKQKLVKNKESILKEKPKKSSTKKTNEDSSGSKKQKKSDSQISISKAETNNNDNKKEKKSLLTKKNLLSYEDKDFLTKRPAGRGSSWDGNSEADGSVNSGLLEEDICFKCGEHTTVGENIILCDMCDGEYHLACTGLEIIPRLKWYCDDCTKESNYFKDKSFDMIPPYKVRYILI